MTFAISLLYCVLVIFTSMSRDLEITASPEEIVSCVMADFIGKGYGNEQAYIFVRQHMLTLLLEETEKAEGAAGGQISGSIARNGSFYVADFLRCFVLIEGGLEQLCFALGINLYDGQQSFQMSNVWIPSVIATAYSNIFMALFLGFDGLRLERDELIVLARREEEDREAKQYDPGGVGERAMGEHEAEYGADDHSGSGLTSEEMEGVFEENPGLPSAGSWLSGPAGEFGNGGWDSPAYTGSNSGGEAWQNPFGEEGDLLGC